MTLDLHRATGNALRCNILIKPVLMLPQNYLVWALKKENIEGGNRVIEFLRAQGALISAQSTLAPGIWPSARRVVHWHCMGGPRLCGRHCAGCYVACAGPGDRTS